MPSAASDLRRDLERAGYYPELVSGALAVAIGGDDVVAHLVHPETTFDSVAVRRHVTVLVLTARRLIVAHVDDHTENAGSARAVAETQALPLRRVESVIVDVEVADPERFRASDLPEAVTLAISLGAMSRVDLEPATCGDPQCEADHGYTGTVASDDIVIRVAAAASGPGSVADAMAFARQLNQICSQLA